MAILVVGNFSNSHSNRVIQSGVKLEWVKECIGGKEIETLRVENFLKEVWLWKEQESITMDGMKCDDKGFFKVEERPE